MKEFSVSGDERPRHHLKDAAAQEDVGALARPMYHAGALVKRHLPLVIILVMLAVFATMSLPSLIPKPVPHPIDEEYEYKPLPAFTSVYGIRYYIPNPVNVTQPQTMSVSFNASSLYGQTNSVEVHWLNVTIIASDGKVLFTQLVRDDKVLTQGQVWGPKQVPFTIDNATVKLKSGSEIAGKVLISIGFDEIAAVPIAGPQHYAKTAAVPEKEITIRSPYASLASAYKFDFYHSTVTAVLVGGLVFALSNIAAIFLALPRFDARLKGSGFRDPTTGQIVGTWKAYRAFISVAMGFVFVAIANIGAAGSQINLMKMITDFFLGRQDVEVLTAVSLWAIGLLMPHR